MGKGDPSAKAVLALAAALCVCVNVATRAAPARPANAEYDLAALQERRIVDTPEYWLGHAVAGEKCDGERVAAVLIRAANVFRPKPPVTSAAEAVDVLLQHGVISSSAYWTKNAVP